MLNRRPLAPNNRHGVMGAQFLESLKSEAVRVNYPKSVERASVVNWPQPGRQNSEGFGGGYRITKR